MNNIEQYQERASINKGVDLPSFVNKTNEQPTVSIKRKKINMEHNQENPSVNKGVDLPSFASKTCEQPAIPTKGKTNIGHSQKLKQRTGAHVSSSICDKLLYYASNILKIMTVD